MTPLSTPYLGRTGAARVARWQQDSTGLPYEPFLLTGSDVAAAAAAFARSGVVTLGPEVLDPDVFRPLVAESRNQRQSACWDLRGGRDVGTLPQDTVRAHLGPLARELCAAGATRALLQAITGRAVLPGWSATCLTYYDVPGQFLGAHKDKFDACHYAFLLYLEVGWPAGTGPGPGLQLHVCAPGSEEDVMLRVTAAPNRVVVLHGSRLTHFRPPLGQGEMVGLLAGCYEVADERSGPRV